MKLNKKTMRPTGWYTATGDLVTKRNERGNLTEKEVKDLRNYNQRIRRAWRKRGEATKAPTIGLRQARQYRKTHTAKELRDAIKKNLRGAKGMASQDSIDNLISMLEMDRISQKGDVENFSDVARKVRRARNELTQSAINDIYAKLYTWMHGYINASEFRNVVSLIIRSNSAVDLENSDEEED